MTGVVEHISLFDDVKPIPLREVIVELQRVEAEIGTEAEAFVWTLENGIAVSFTREMTPIEMHRKKYADAARLAARADGWQPKPWGGVPDKYYPPFDPLDESGLA